MISIHSTYFTFPQLLPSFVNRETAQKIGAIAQEALSQLVVALAVNVTARIVLGALFTPIVVNAVLCALPVILLTLVVIKIAHRCFEGSAPMATLNAWAEKISGYAARSAIATALTLKLNHFIHEWGHGAAALMTYIKANPQVHFDAAGGGTDYAFSYGLTRFGKLLGEQRAM